jgi:hypothetical protein
MAHLVLLWRAMVIQVTSQASKVLNTCEATWNTFRSVKVPPNPPEVEPEVDQIR